MMMMMQWIPVVLLLATVKNSFALVYSANLLKRCDIILTCITMVTRQGVGTG